MDAEIGAAATTLVSKAEFARRVKRSAGRVTQWISEGKIHGAALELNAGREMIVLETAVAQLGLSLDVGQQIGQDAPILPLAPSPQGIPAGDDSERHSVDAATADLQSRLAVAKVQSAEIKAEEDRRRVKEQNGDWIRAADVAAVWGRGLSELVSRIESEFPGMADRLSGEFKIDPRALAIALRREFRGVRAKLAIDTSARRDALPTAAVEDADKAAA